ncbi:hypothetical protein QTI66_34900 [Variovorax sp. J22R133]|uniref:hypothetical protein n=1 Tax=Variovorax brevis TaxID=3053503 RepID=UPI0025773C79|nr:hypothetical protein [Variovorax sp. J22R133]MDM0117308.1 hypothetical protein [Variovorax sp. J22R133]
MIVFDILPLFGVGPLRFGSAREAVRKALGAPQDESPGQVPGQQPLMTDAWCDGRFKVHYDGTSVAACRVGMTLDPRFGPRLYGLMVFAVPAAILLDRLAAHTHMTHELAPGDACGPQACVFPALALALCRSRREDTYFSRICVGNSTPRKRHDD